MKQGAAGRQLLLIRFLFLVIQPPIIPSDVCFMFLAKPSTINKYLLQMQLIHIV